MKKKTICITGQNGFVGSHLYNTLKLFEEKYIIKEFKNEFFNDSNVLDKIISECDTIIHLAALNRHIDDKVIYETNIDLSKRLIDSLVRLNSNAQIIMSSSIQEDSNNYYGKSKKDSRNMFIELSKKKSNNFVGLVIQNVFGPFCSPNYNSFISTFCNKLINENTPKIIEDKTVSLIYVEDLVEIIIDQINNNHNNHEFTIDNLHNYKVSKILNKLTNFKLSYIDCGIIPNLDNDFDLNLFNTFRSYIDYNKFFPVNYKLNSDKRGNFVEIGRFESGGQISFSTTKKGIVRGNHFHRRKIERFSVIKGKALIQIRKIGTNEIIEFILDGNNPSYVDIPIWYTHNIKNIGNEDLFTNFWINESYNEKDPDTYFLEV